MAVERMAPADKPIPQKALRSWSTDLYAAIKAGRDPNLVIANAVQCGLARPDMDRFPGWAETLGDQPPDAIAGTLVFRFAAFDRHVDALTASLRGLMAEGFGLDAIEQAAAAVQAHAEAGEPNAVGYPVGLLDRGVRHHRAPDPDRAEVFAASEAFAFDTKGRFHPTYRGRCS